MAQQKVFGFEMARISEVYLSTLSQIMKPHGLERYFLPLLHLIEHSGNVTQQDLATALKIDKVTAMRIVDYLSERELIVRKPDNNDRRCYKLEVTRKAIDLAPKIVSGIRQTDDLLLRDFTETERSNFLSGMDKLYKRIGEFPEPDYIVTASKRSAK